MESASGARRPQRDSLARACARRTCAAFNHPLEIALTGHAVFSRHARTHKPLIETSFEYSGATWPVYRYRSNRGKEA